MYSKIQGTEKNNKEMKNNYRRRIKLSSDSKRGNRSTDRCTFTGLIWFIGWLFTIGFVGLGFWKAVLGIIIWPYFLGVALK